MKTYPSEYWKTLGDWVAAARKQAGYSDTKAWASTVGRSTRQVLGLERGEAVGPKTIEAVADALEVGPWALFAVLDSGNAPHSWSEAKAVAAAERRAAELDRQAMENPEPSDYYTSPEGDEVDEPVTWGHMEARLSEIEKRIVRLERQALRAAGRPTGSPNLGGGEGDALRPSSTSHTPAAGPADEPAKQDDYGLAAHDEEHTIESEQEVDEFP